MRWRMDAPDRYVGIGTNTYTVNGYLGGNGKMYWVASAYIKKTRKEVGIFDTLKLAQRRCEELEVK